MSGHVDASWWDSPEKDKAIAEHDAKVAAEDAKRKAGEQK